MPAFAHELRVRYGECDPQGIVFNPNYLAYFDHTVTELWRASSLGSWEAWSSAASTSSWARPTSASAPPARFDDLITVSAEIAHFGTTCLKLELLIHRGDELLIEGWLRQVFVDAKTLAKTPIPEWVREALAPYVAST